MIVALTSRGNHRPRAYQERLEPCESFLPQPFLGDQECEGHSRLRVQTVVEGLVASSLGEPGSAR